MLRSVCAEKIRRLVPSASGPSQSQGKEKGTYTEQNPEFDCCFLPPGSRLPELRSPPRRPQRVRPPSHFWFWSEPLSSASSCLQFCCCVWLLRWPPSVAAGQTSEVQTSRAACCVPAPSQRAGVDRSHPQTCRGNASG